MVKHIVLFKLNETLTETQRNEIITNFKQIVESLPTKIDQLLLDRKSTV